MDDAMKREMTRFLLESCRQMNEVAMAFANQFVQLQARIEQMENDYYNAVDEIDQRFRNRIFDLHNIPDSDPHRDVARDVQSDFFYSDEKMDVETALDKLYAEFALIPYREHEGSEHDE